MPPIPPTLRRSWRPLAVASLAAAALLVGLSGSSAPASADGAKGRDWKSAAAKVDDLIAGRLKAQKDLVVAPLAPTTRSSCGACTST